MLLSLWPNYAWQQFSRSELATVFRNEDRTNIPVFLHSNIIFVRWPETNTRMKLTVSQAMVEVRSRKKHYPQDMIPAYNMRASLKRSHPVKYRQQKSSRLRRCLAWEVRGTLHWTSWRHGSGRTVSLHLWNATAATSRLCQTIITGLFIAINR